MRVLLDSCIAAAAKSVLIGAGFDVVWIGDQSPDPGDEAVLTIALGEGRVVVTLDKDFGELAVVRGLPHHGIMRLVNCSSRLQAPLAIRVLESHGAELLAGAIVTAEPGRIRVRLPDPPKQST